MMSFTNNSELTCIEFAKTIMITGVQHLGGKYFKTHVSFLQDLYKLKLLGMNHCVKYAT